MKKAKLCDNYTKLLQISYTGDDLEKMKTNWSLFIGALTFAYDRNSELPERDRTFTNVFDTTRFVQRIGMLIKVKNQYRSSKILEEVLTDGALNEPRGTRDAARNRSEYKNVSLEYQWTMDQMRKQFPAGSF